VESITTIVFTYCKQDKAQLLLAQRTCNAHKNTHIERRENNAEQTNKWLWVVKSGLGGAMEIEGEAEGKIARCNN